MLLLMRLSVIKSMKKRLIKIAVVILVISISYFLVRNASSNLNVKNKITIKSKANETKKLSSNNAKIPPTSETEQLLQHVESDKSEFKPQPFQIRDYLAQCGAGLDDENALIFKMLNKEGLSPAQLIARAAFLERCEKWYKYSLAQSESETFDMFKKMKDGEELESYFVNAPNVMVKFYRRHF